MRTTWGTCPIFSILQHQGTWCTVGFCHCSTRILHLWPTAFCQVAAFCRKQQTEKLVALIRGTTTKMRRLSVGVLNRGIWRQQNLHSVPWAHIKRAWRFLENLFGEGGSPWLHLTAVFGEPFPAGVCWGQVWRRGLEERGESNQRMPCPYQILPALLLLCFPKFRFFYCAKKNPHPEDSLPSPWPGTLLRWEKSRIWKLPQQMHLRCLRNKKKCSCTIFFVPFSLGQ